MNIQLDSSANNIYIGDLESVDDILLLHREWLAVRRAKALFHWACWSTRHADELNLLVSGLVSDSQSVTNGIFANNPNNPTTGDQT